MRLLALALLVGCSFNVTPQSGAVTCATTDDCPGALECCGSPLACRDDCGAQPDAGADGADAGGCPDTDSDGVCDADDNCPKNANPGQGDCDGNGSGDACEPMWTAECVTLRHTLATAGGLTGAADRRLIGTVGEPAHTVSSGSSYRLRGGLLPARGTSP